MQVLPIAPVKDELSVSNGRAMNETLGKEIGDVQARSSSDRFGRFATETSRWLGSKWGFCGAVLIVFVWGMAGPVFHFSDAWQLVINTGTTIVTFLMVFLIQNTQNRDARAINLKLNELIRAVDKARDHMIDIETLSDLELEELHSRYEKIKLECTERENKRLVQRKSGDPASPK
jgi:low affinity Fe/Cu permease